MLLLVVSGVLTALVNGHRAICTIASLCHIGPLHLADLFVQPGLCHLPEAKAQLPCSTSPAVLPSAASFASAWLQLKLVWHLSEVLLRPSNVSAEIRAQQHLLRAVLHGEVPPLTRWSPFLLAGLILVNEPYYNEAGFDSDRGLQEGYENSRCYNEMTLIRVVQSMMQLLRRPVEVFEHEIREHFRCNGWRLVSRIESWLETNELVERSHEQANGADAASLLSACGTLAESPADAAGSLGEDGSAAEQGAAAELSDSALDGKEELDDSEFTTSTPNAGDLQQYSDSESTGQARGSDLARDRTDEGKAAQDSASQPSVKPKKRRKSYRSFLPEKSGYPDIGFPLFPLSKGFIKSIRGVLQQYRAALAGANIPEWTEDK